VSGLTGVFNQAMNALEATHSLEQLEAKARTLGFQLEQFRADLAAVKQQLVAAPSVGNAPVQVAGRAEFRVALEKVVAENRELLSRLAK
jgi:hypothetical protein